MPRVFFLSGTLQSGILLNVIAPELLIPNHEKLTDVTGLNVAHLQANLSFFVGGAVFSAKFRRRIVALAPPSLRTDSAAGRTVGVAAPRTPLPVH
jgi:hypothetical protein